MRRSNRLGRLGLALLLGLAPVFGRAGEDSAPLYRLTVTGCTKAINYRYLDGQSRVQLQGTVLQPTAGGQAIVRGRSGGMLIRMKLHGLEPAYRLGPGYLTYVLWAISPTGSPSNLGEVEVRHGRARVEATTHLHTFGLVLTAEPHFAVTRVSNAVVMENVVPSGHGRVQAVEASYELLPRGDAPLALVAGAADLDAKASPYVSQARLALRIAEAEGAGELAPLEYRRAKGLLEQMEAEKHLRSRPAILLARQAIQEAGPALVRDLPVATYY